MIGICLGLLETRAQRRSRGIRDRLDEAFPFALRKEHRPEGVEPAAVSMRGDARGRDPIDVITTFFAKVTAQEPTAAQLDLLRSAYEQAGRRA